MHEEFVRDYILRKNERVEMVNAEIEEDRAWGIFLDQEQNFYDAFIDHFHYQERVDRKRFPEPIRGLRFMDLSAGVDAEELSGVTFHDTAQEPEAEALPPIRSVNVKGTDLYHWRDIIEARFGTEYDDLLESEVLISRMVTGMSRFLERSLLPSGLETNECRIAFDDAQKEHGIPWTLKEEFENWFDRHASSDFREFDDSLDSEETPPREQRQNADNGDYHLSEEEEEEDDDLKHFKMAKSLQEQGLNDSFPLHITPTKSVEHLEERLWSDSTLEPMHFSFGESPRRPAKPLMPENRHQIQAIQVLTVQGLDVQMDASVQEEPLDVQMDPTVNAHQDPSVNASVATPMNELVQEPLDAPMQVPLDIQIDAPVEKLLDVPMDLPVDTGVNIHMQMPMDVPMPMVFPGQVVTETNLIEPQEAEKHVDPIGQFLEQILTSARQELVTQEGSF